MIARTMIRPVDWRILPILGSLVILSLYAWFMFVNEWWVLGGDADAYYLAAERIVAGEPLYTSEGNYSQLYRYAPWFAYMLVPLTALPREVFMAGMGSLCLAASVAVLWPLRRPSYETLALLLLIAPPLLHFAYLGNIQPILVAAVMYLPARGVWIGVAASLKGAPLALAIPYAAWGRWRTVAVAVTLTVVAVAPMALMDLSGYPANTGVAFGLWKISPWLTIAAGMLGGAITWIVALRWRRYALLAAGATVILASPHLFLGYLSWVLIGTRDDS